MPRALCAGDEANRAVFFGEIDHHEIDDDERRGHVVKGRLRDGIVKEFAHVRVQRLSFCARHRVIAAATDEGVILAVPDRFENRRGGGQVDQHLPFGMLDLIVEGVTREAAIGFFERGLSGLLSDDALRAVLRELQLCGRQRIFDADKTVAVKNRRRFFNFSG